MLEGWIQAKILCIDTNLYASSQIIYEYIHNRADTDYYMFAGISVSPWCSENA